MRGDYHTDVDRGAARSRLGAARDVNLVVEWYRMPWRFLVIDVEGDAKGIRRGRGGFGMQDQRDMRVSLSVGAAGRMNDLDTVRASVWILVCDHA